MKVIYSADKKIIRGRLAVWLLIFAGAGCVYFGFDFLQTYGARPADGDVLAPFAVRLGGAVAFWIAGVVCALGGIIYGRIFIAKMEIDEGRENLLIHTLNPVGWRSQTVALSDVSVGNFYEGKMVTGIKPSVDAPWYTVRIKSRWLPLILDAQGHTSEVNPTTWNY
ncbi:MAG: hypothetical protein FJ128_05800 [Deltaproteobacteria bacterium]|nr:hypothetical protein [Deltaproteobacteria bacterium]